MLSKETIDIVKSTVPLLQDKGVLITSNFYERLFDTAPELKNIFNLANQKDNTQSRALADAVLAYAGNLDNLEVLLPAVSRIANKHASLGVLPEHYPLVGSCLLQSIQEVAELPEDHPALAAWGEAYGVLADVFTQSEDALYKQSEAASGGWKGFRDFTIEQIIPETPEVSSFILKPSDDKEILSFEGGQYISVKLANTADGYDQIRQYSLSEWSAEPNRYRISVKKEKLGNVSNNIHSYSQGQTLQISPPFGDFTLNKNKTEHAFIAAGVGITPLFSMMQQAREQQTASSLTFISCSRSAEHQIFKDQLSQLESTVTIKRAFEEGDSGDLSGLLNAGILNEWLPNKSADVYFCGPLPFMKLLKQLLNEVGFEDSQLHYEVFGPTTAL
ncbi:NO-inducible flavohemoprotein [Leucothrix sargassi]|nr:NO-inducible flavohemoprotein [Leucothrix sargassi]